MVRQAIFAWPDGSVCLSNHPVAMNGLALALVLAFSLTGALACSSPGEQPPDGQAQASSDAAPTPADTHTGPRAVETATVETPVAETSPHVAEHVAPQPADHTTPRGVTAD